ncbi:MAG: hypothetical protein L6R42_002557 [Xanthoria sp. 1 TBL-2021]|nr:MAG: hypothetical protein L6R42_002557 [Xanthoria sp. 1 TBL-2021]
MYEYIACFMEEWKHQASITSWTPDFEAPVSIPRELEPQTEEREHEVNIAPWTPNPEAFDFVPGGFGVPIPLQLAVTIERGKDEEADFRSAQTTYEEEICRQYEMDLYMDYMRHLWAPAVYYHHP